MGQLIGSLISCGAELYGSRPGLGLISRSKLSLSLLLCLSEMSRHLLGPSALLAPSGALLHTIAQLHITLYWGDYFKGGNLLTAFKVFAGFCSLFCAECGMMILASESALSLLLQHSVHCTITNNGCNVKTSRTNDVKAGCH